MKLISTLVIGLAIILTSACSSNKASTAKNEVQAQVPVTSEVDRNQVQKNWDTRIDALKGRVNDLRHAALNKNRKYNGSHAQLRKVIRKANKELAQATKEAKHLKNVSAEEFKAQSADLDHRLDTIESQLDNAKIAE